MQDTETILKCAAAFAEPVEVLNLPPRIYRDISLRYDHQLTVGGLYMALINGQCKKWRGVGNKTLEIIRFEIIRFLKACEVDEFVLEHIKEGK